MQKIPLPDGGYYDPTGELGLSYTGLEAIVVGGGDPDKIIVPDRMTPETASRANQLLEGTGLTVPEDTGTNIIEEAKGTSNPAKINTYASGRTEDVWIATDNKEFTDFNQYVTHQNNLNNSTDPKNNNNNFGGFNNNTISEEDDSVQNVMGSVNNEKRQSAFEVMKERFTAMGLGSLATEIEKIFKGEARTKAGSSIPIPTSESGFYLALIETQAYYDRFGKVNEARIKSGYTALDERTILGMEDEYQKIMKAYGMPAGFYDSPEDFQTLLANDKSELEVADILQASRQFAATVDPAIKNQLKSVYNIDESALSAFIADPEKGQQVLNQLATKSLTGAAALLSGLTQQAAEVAQGFGAGEMRFQEQQRRFGQAATLAERGQFLSEIDRSERAFGEQEAVEVTFGGLEQSIRAAERLASRERARFGGVAGTTTSSFTRPTAGQI